MNVNGHGGARPGSGRKATGHTKKSYTITLPIEVGMDLERRAEQCDMKVNKYIRDFIIEAGHYNIESTDELLVSLDSIPVAAEDVKPYKRNK